MTFLAQHFPYGDDFTKNPTTDLTDPLKQVVTENQGQNDSFIEQVLKIFGFNVGEQGGGNQVITIFSYIQGIVNIALSLLSFISLIILIYYFFLIFFSSEKEGVENAQKAIKRVTYVLVIIGLSWLFVSFMFWVVSKIIG
ncbi:MAG TPA: hypothetical protein PLW93_02190 [Candidatus Absconditabacterales bacterium]|nr:hypothetical protein [Candidatus Absconditabacterales bacterium]HNG97058.1 hypothetical protein [Candidatus Absconditabacterales bacterium]